MPSDYLVQYLDSENNLTQKIISSNSATEIENDISRNGGEVLSVVQKKSLSINIQLGDPVKLQEKTNFIQQLKTMLSSGVSLVQALEIATKQINNQNFSGPLQNIINDIKQGEKFSDSLAKYPKIFDEVAVAMIRAGERGGILDKMLEELEKALKKDVEISDNLKKATRYPKIVGSIMLVSMYVVIAKVIPTFTSILTDSGTEIPTLTVVLLSLGDFLNAYGLMMVGAIILLVVASNFYGKTDSGRLLFDKLALKNPLFKFITVAAINLRFTKILGTLLSFGVPLKDSLSVVKNVANNRIYSDAIDKIISDIDSGKPLEESIKEVGVFSDYLCSMVGVGEKIGALDKMFLSASEYYEVELKNNTEGLSAAIEPIITIVMGVFIAIFVGSVFLPMFKMYESISG
ncbi:MAG: type II secretion system F family protein [Candidatus Marinimicrobia bacterium]|nr:type II secretion system F family protein [Candidatus Neomarinimicrobiota bacterium]